ncbi:MAG TPA: class I lanthipeptide [Kofleriaceae bacterium]|jgi:hypothetical protein|nr:class I lanthipeptide [Kofleriaceae bacterium]
MKKTVTSNQKLKLRKTTVKILSDLQIDAVHGGNLTQSYNSCGDSACPLGEKCRL